MHKMHAKLTVPNLNRSLSKLNFVVASCIIKTYNWRLKGSAVSGMTYESKRQSITPLESGLNLPNYKSFRLIHRELS